MFTKSCLAPVAAMVVLAGSASTVAAQDHAGSLVEGTWAGSFASTEWTFEFKHEGGSWSGRYMSARSGKWVPMQSLAVSGNTVRFAIEAKPPVAFSLEVDKANKAMTGDVAIFGKKLPFTATRKS